MTAALVQKLWNYDHILSPAPSLGLTSRDDGRSYGDNVEPQKTRLTVISRRM